MLRSRFKVRTFQWNHRHWQVTELQPAATVTAVSVDWGTAGSKPRSFQTAADGVRLLPAGRNTDLPWSGINRLEVTFNEPEMLTAAEVTVTSFSAGGVNYAGLRVTMLRLG